MIWNTTLLEKGTLIWTKKIIINIFLCNYKQPKSARSAIVEIHLIYCTVLLININIKYIFALVIKLQKHLNMKAWNCTVHLFCIIINTICNTIRLISSCQKQNTGQLYKNVLSNFLMLISFIKMQFCNIKKNICYYCNNWINLWVCLKTNKK